MRPVGIERFAVLVTLFTAGFSESSELVANDIQSIWTHFALDCMTTPMPLIKILLITFALICFSMNAAAQDCVRGEPEPRAAAVPSLLYCYDSSDEAWARHTVELLRADGFRLFWDKDMDSRRTWSETWPLPRPRPDCLPA